jgi:hypothetical protein
MPAPEKSKSPAALRDKLLPKLLRGELSTNAKPQTSNA